MTGIGKKAQEQVLLFCHLKLDFWRRGEDHCGYNLYCGQKVFELEVGDGLRYGVQTKKNRNGRVVGLFFASRDALFLCLPEYSVVRFKLVGVLLEAQKTLHNFLKAQIF